MKQKHYTYFTVFIIIALLMMTTAAWRDYVRSDLMVSTPTTVGY